MKFEFSAGGIVYKKENGQTDILLCQHSHHHGWVFPKGLIGDHDKKESKEETALREVFEESGARAEIIHQLTPVVFWYVWEGEKRKKTVYYYVMKYISGDITKHDFEMENVEWVRLEDVEKRLTYKNDVKLWKEAKEIIVQN